MALAQHIMIRRADGGVLLRDAGERRIFAYQTHRIGRARGLLSFGAADTHAHLIAACSRETAGRLAQAVECSLQWQLGAEIGFAPAHFKAIADQGHLYSGFRYAIGQDRRHGTRLDPYLEATCLPDLVGLRVGFPDYVERVRAMLPRLRIDQLREMLPAVQPGAALDPTVLATAAAAAVGLAELRGSCRRARLARAAAAQVGADLPAHELVGLLGSSTRQLRRLLRQEVDAALLGAVRAQWALRSSQLARNVTLAG